MAIVVENATFIPYSGTAATTVNFAYSMSNGTAGTNRALIIMHHRDVGGGYSLVYNSVNPTAQLQKVTAINASLEYFKDSALPTDTSSHNIAVTYGGARTNCAVWVIELSGVRQSVLPINNLTGDTNTDPHTISLTTLIDGIKTFLMYGRIENRDMDTDVTYDTLHYSTDTGSEFDGVRIGEVTGPTPAASTNYTWNPSANSTWRAAALAVQENSSTQWGNIYGTQTGGRNGFNTFFWYGGTSPVGSTNVLESISINMVTSGNIRLALYSGGSAGDPSGATLLEDLGTFAHGGTGFETFSSTTNPTLPDGSLIWIASKDDGFTSARYEASGLPGEEIAYAVSRSGDQANGAWASPAPTGSYTTEDFQFLVYLTYSSGGAGPADLTFIAQTNEVN